MLPAGEVSSRSRLDSAAIERFLLPPGYLLCRQHHCSSRNTRNRHARRVAAPMRLIAIGAARPEGHASWGRYAQHD